MTPFPKSSLLLLAFSAIAASAEEQEFPHALRPVPDPLGCAVTGTCPPCDAKPRDCKPRIRRSWGTLSDSEKKQFIDAIKIMKTTTTKVGQASYGADFTNYDELTLQHAAAASDPRGDQGHLDQHFVVFHRLFLLKFENSLLAVDPAISGLPYWDIQEGLEEVFGPNSLSFGSVPGTGPNSEVIDGAFADWKISSYDPQVEEEHDLYEGFGDIFSNATGTTMLRTTGVLTESLVRYPTCDGAQDMGVLAYTPENYETCVSQTNFAQFNWCLDTESANWVHGAAHFLIGSTDSDLYGFGCPWFSPPNMTASGVRQGDYIDKFTSPNDPIFWLHHAFLDRISLEFMKRNQDQANQYWGFKASSENGTVPEVVEGTFLDDVISSAWPFEGDIVYSEDAPQGPLTFADALCHVGPQTAIYTYDSFGDDLCATLDEDESIQMDDISSAGAGWAMIFPAIAAAIIGMIGTYMV